MRRRRVGVAVAFAALVAWSLPACIGPVRSRGAYETKASSTARDMVSPLQSARLAVTVARRHDAFSEYVDVALTDAEDDAGSIAQTFQSIQPPDDPARALRGTLDQLLSTGVDTLEQLRVAARLGEGARMVELAKPLEKLAGELQSFAEAHH